ncbi:YckD family protein [Evansella sp. AB-P1]|uniref:YckD family protein n=1 Tax=Evansella sp. AB-P1 TaxID=3037653 RepID=UPI00241F0193|nr:YckD family protein [Evansella sp. AB-P1]MDG5786125.1 YckD family protein [Evansella sp. AB-P1]
MKKVFVSMLAALFLSIGTLGVTTDVSAEEVSDIQLTEEQKNEMSELQSDVLEKKKEIINKYVEYGVFTSEKGEKIKQHLDKHYSKLEKNGFIPKWDKLKKQNGNEED